MGFRQSVLKEAYKLMTVWAPYSLHTQVSHCPLNVIGFTYK